MQAPEKSCSQCHARKTKCDLRQPRCSKCTAKNLSCEFYPRRKPGPHKGFKTRGERQTHTTTGIDLDNSSILPLGVNTLAPISALELDLSRHLNTVHDSVEANLPPTSDNSVISDRLLDLYLSLDLFPLLPPFRRPRPFLPDTSPQLKSALKDAVSAVVSNFTTARTWIMSPEDPKKIANQFYIQALSFLNSYLSRQDFRPSLDLIKLTLLISIFDQMCSSSSNAWYMTGLAVRLSYDIGLDCVDDPSFGQGGTLMSDKEECRWVWWCVYTLDTYTSTTLLRPFAITDDEIRTALVSSTTDEFKSGNGGTNEPLRFVSNDLLEIQSAFQMVDFNNPVGIFQIYLLALALGRSVARLRRSLLAGKNENHRIELHQNVLSTVWFSLPESLFDTCSYSVNSRTAALRFEVASYLYM